jgi:hypothetical protein
VLWKLQPTVLFLIYMKDYKVLPYL